jgi:hypothetical protein
MVITIGATMKNLFISILILLAFALNVEARMNAAVIGGGVVATGCNYTGCSAGCKLFDWDCSTTTVTNNVCTMGADKVATLGGEANLTSGYINITDATGNGADWYYFDIAAYDVFPAGDFTLEMTIYFTSRTSSQIIFKANFDATNYRRIQISSGGDVQILHLGNNVGGTVTFDTNFTTGVSYTLIIKASTTLGMSVKVNANDALTDVTNLTTTTHNGTVAAGLSMGNTSSNAAVMTVDNVRISYGWRTDI